VARRHYLRRARNVTVGKFCWRVAVLRGESLSELYETDILVISRLAITATSAVVTLRPNRRLHRCLSIDPVLLDELTFFASRSS
jgi:hypothetical protein